MRPRGRAKGTAVFSLQYSMPVVKYDRKGFKPRPRQILLTTSAAYLVEEAKIKQRVLYTSLKGPAPRPLRCGQTVSDHFSNS